MRLPFTALLLSLAGYGWAQSAPPTIGDALDKYGFVMGQVVQDGDTFTYYLKDYDTAPTNLVVYIQGTDPNPLFSYQKKEEEYSIYRWFGDDYQRLDETYTFAIVPKPGMAGIFDDSDIQVPAEFYEKNYLDYRVRQVDLSIRDILARHVQNPEKVIVYGHSEGATLAAPLALANESITHLGFWSGNVLNNFYEFSLFNRLEAVAGNLSDSAAHQNIMGILQWYASVIDSPNSTELDHFGYTNKRWSSYERAPIEYLLELDIPIFAYFATEDESTPIETAYLLPVQFMQKRKTNLTFDVCVGCNHAYESTQDGEVTKHWSEVFRRFIDWTNE